MEKPRDGEHSVLRAKLASVSLSPAERDVVAAGGSELRALARQKAALGQVPALLEGETRLGVPVYVIWGEEDDIRVIERLRATTSLVRPWIVRPFGAARSGGLTRARAHGHDTEYVGPTRSPICT